MLLLDEPLASLDIKYQFDLFHLLKEITRERGVSVLMSLHDIGMGAILDRLLLAKDGRLVTQGEPGMVLTDKIIQTTYDLNGSISTFMRTSRTFCRTLAVASA